MITGYCKRNGMLLSTSLLAYEWTHMLKNQRLYVKLYSVLKLENPGRMMIKPEFITVGYSAVWMKVWMNATPPFIRSFPLSPPPPPLVPITDETVKRRRHLRMNENSQCTLTLKENRGSEMLIFGSRCKGVGWMKVYVLLVDARR